MAAELTQAALAEAARTLPAGEPVYMINIVRYRDRAEYAEGTGMPPCTGREAYLERYASAFNAIGRDQDYGVFFVGNVRGTLVGTDGERWDDVVIVRYASFAVLKAILDSPAYAREAAPHHRAALADWKFIGTTQPSTSGQA